MNWILAILEDEYPEYEFDIISSGTRTTTGGYTEKVPPVAFRLVGKKRGHKLPILCNWMEFQKSNFNKDLLDVCRTYMDNYIKINKKQNEHI